MTDNKKLKTMAKCELIALVEHLEKLNGCQAKRIQLLADELALHQTNSIQEQALRLQAAIGQPQFNQGMLQTMAQINMSQAAANQEALARQQNISQRCPHCGRGGQSQ